MEIRKSEFPVTLQAFEIRDKREEFIAEQVVHSQSEADRFTSRFNGKLIKAHALERREARKYDHPAQRSMMPGWAIFVLILVVLVAIAYFTGYLQPLIQRF